MAETFAERMARQSDDAFEAKHGEGNRPNGTERLNPNELLGADMTDEELVAFRRYLFLEEYPDTPHPNDLDWDYNDTPALSVLQEHYWLAGYRAGKRDG